MLANIQTASSMLARTPDILRSILSGADAGWTEPNYGPGTWSAREIVAHLIFGERTDWMVRLRVIVAHGDSRAFEPFDRAGHGPLAQEQTVDELLDLFARERSANLEALLAMDLSDEDLDRRGLHPALGPVTARQLLATWVVHDLNHIAQIAKAMAYQLGNQVGAWREYLSILAPPNPR
jgi:uncharacterized damage-inducible protein DinB